MMVDVFEITRIEIRPVSQCEGYFEILRICYNFCEQLFGDAAFEGLIAKAIYMSRCHSRIIHHGNSFIFGCTS